MLLFCRPLVFVSGTRKLDRSLPRLHILSGRLVCSDIPVLKIISVLVSIKFELSHFSISFYRVSELFSVLVSIKCFRNNFSSVSGSVFTSFQ